NQLKEQYSKAGLPAQFIQQMQQTIGAKQPPAQPAQQTPQTKQEAAATAAKPAAAPAKPAAAPAPVAAAPASAETGAYEQQVADLVNKERAAAGLPALKVNTNLAGVAEKKAEDLRDKNYFDHNSPTYGSPFDMMKQFGIKYSTAGENIAKGQRTPADVMNGWMNSPGHKANIMNANYTEIGVGYVTDSNGGTYWVQMFIRP
ncbi:MAG: CAP domain-containing protein, partial [Eubacteriales bacterium]|nr:CAP domain-containing protein [Eubacteriales bacterium]